MSLKAGKYILSKLKLKETKIRKDMKVSKEEVELPVAAGDVASLQKRQWD